MVKRSFRFTALLLMSASGPSGGDRRVDVLINDMFHPVRAQKAPLRGGLSPRAEDRARMVVRRDKWNRKVPVTGSVTGISAAIPA